jgi:hypothetical protein
VRRALYAILYYFWVSLPAGMGMPPWHRLHPIFKLEQEAKK